MESSAVGSAHAAAHEDRQHSLAEVTVTAGLSGVNDPQLS